MLKSPHPNPTKRPASHLARLSKCSNNKETAQTIDKSIMLWYICTKVYYNYIREMGKKAKQLHIRIDEALYKKLKVKCVYKDTSIQEYVANLISEGLGEYSASEVPKNKTARKRSSKRLGVKEQP